MTTTTTTRLCAVVFLALSAFACGGNGQPTKSPHAGAAGKQQQGPDREPTEGICDDAKTTKKPPTVEAATDAMKRGCPREALALLANIKAEPGTPEEISRRFLILEAREDVLAYGFDELAPLWHAAQLALEPWMFAGEPENRDDGQTAITLAEEGLKGRLPGTAFEDGRLGRAFIRGLPTYTCARTVSPTLDAQVRNAGREMLFRLFKQGILVKPSQSAPGFQRTLARIALTSCDLEAAPQLFVKAAASARAASRPDLADEAILNGLEAAAFTGGRAGDFELPEILPMQFTRAAAKDEAAKQGVGDGPAIAKKLDQSLNQALPNLSTPAARVRAEWIRAVASLRLEGASRKASEQAIAVEKQAAALRRADLLDAARMVHLLAALDLDNAADAEHVGSLLARSLAKRGAVAATHRAGTLLINAANRYGMAGRSEAVTVAARLAIEFAKPLPLLPSMQIRSPIPRLYMMGGRVEEAYDLMQTLEAELKPRVNELPMGIGTQFLSTLADARRQYLVELGDDGRGESNQDPLEVELRLAIDSGDPRNLERFMLTGPEDERDGRVFAIAGMSCALARPYLRGASDRMLANLRAIVGMNIEEALEGGATKDPATIQKFAEFQMMKVQLLKDVPPVAATIASCGVALSDRSLVAFGRELYVQSTALQGGGAVPDPDDLAIHDALASEAAGQFEVAARRYLELGRRFYQRSGASAAGGVGASATSHSTFEAGARAAVRAGNVALAISILEESRGRDLRALRARPTSAPSSSDLSKLVAIERKISDEQGRSRALAQLISAARSDADRAALKKTASEAKERLAALERERDAEGRAVASRNPAAYQAAALAPPRSLKEIQSVLGKDEALVYLHGGESAYAIVVDSENAQRVLLSDPLGLALTIGQFQNLLKERIKGGGRGLVLEGGKSPTPSASNIEVARRNIYARLIAPIEPFVARGKRLIIVPDEDTASLPFAELASSDGTILIERNPLRVVPGAFMLGARKSLRKIESSQALVVGDPDFGDTKSRDQALASSSGRGGRGIAATGAWKSLPGTRTEANAVAKTYGSTPLLGVSASESNVVSALSGKRVVHLATHGFADMRRPQYSALILAKPTGGEDGLLHAYEIERLHIDADVVVLSACETGRGQQRGSEGSLALDRAFLSAGVGAVVSSLWVVDDDSTALLMSKFHDRVRAGDPADVALRAAMLAVRSSPDHANPHFWSAFRVIGGGAR